MMELFSPFFITGMVVVLMAFLTLCFQRKHLLNSLLSLEMMALGLFILLLTLAGSNSNEGVLSLMLLTFSACEASIGLAMLVVLIRTHGNDYVFSLSIHKC
uniref:NADH-ubiquinone oxidoreductase chain 4L n=1 Tax=Hanleyella oldroydi TaxID=515356 RepID=A0A6H1PG67_9MOLL|nr:NADH dehydrogenase subunit 4L [Hanleyella oldroydi]QIZ12619.1 NADH dehydrogenase subunit 4L [Hanleyella oldroydi]